MDVSTRKTQKFLICCQDQTLDIQKKSFTLTTFKMYISKGQNQVLVWYVVVG